MHVYVSDGFVLCITDQSSVHRCPEGLVQGWNAEVWLAAYSRAEESVWNHLDNFLQQWGGRNKCAIPVLKVTNKVILKTVLDICLGGKYVDKMFSMRNQEIYTGLTVVNLHVPMVPMCLFTSPTALPNTGCCFKVCPSFSYTFLPPFCPPSLQNKINWIFITELKLFHFYTDEISSAVFD